MMTVPIAGCGLALLVVTALIGGSCAQTCGAAVKSFTLTGLASPQPAIGTVIITIGFTPAANLRSGDLVTLNMPASYFTGSATATGSMTGAVSFTSTTITIAAQADITAAGLTVTLTSTTANSFKSGTPVGAGCGVFSINTPYDLKSNEVAAPVLGGQITGVSMTTATAVPGSVVTAAAVVVKFTVDTVADLSATTGEIVINFPSGLFSVAPDTPTMTMTTAGTVPTLAVKAGSSATTMTLTLSAQPPS